MSSRDSAPTDASTPNDASAPTDAAPPALSVSDFLAEVKDMLQDNFDAELKVTGELSSFKSYSSGHWYFSLKDNDAQISCVMFKGNNSYVAKAPQDGELLVLTGRPDIYMTRGQFQFIVSEMERAGVGGILQEFERIKRKLQEEGLFDDEHKKPVPAFIRRLCVITSDQGAALHDVHKVLSRRQPMMQLVLAPSLVQGEKAAENVIEMLGFANQQGDFDAVLITRGGGSPEDLHCFNDERLARAIFASKLPVISAVGHEVDFTICDFVADMRAPTPSAAAEELSIDSEAILTELAQASTRMQIKLGYRINERLQDLDELGHRLMGQRILEDKSRDLRGLDDRCRQLLTLYLSRLSESLASLQSRIHSQNPYVVHKHSIAELQTLKAHVDTSFADFVRYKKSELAITESQLHRTLETKLERIKAELSNKKTQLRAMSPLDVLKRGYSLVWDAKGKLVTDARKMSRGDALKLRLDRGELDASVTDITDTEK